MTYIERLEALRDRPDTYIGWGAEVDDANRAMVAEEIQQLRARRTTMYPRVQALTGVLLGGLVVEAARKSLSDEARNRFLRERHHPRPACPKVPRLKVVSTGRQAVLFDVAYPSGAVTRYMLPSHLWGSLCHSAACRGSLASAWAHLSRRWFERGYLDAGNVEELEPAAACRDRMAGFWLRPSSPGFDWKRIPAESPRASACSSRMPASPRAPSS